MKFYVIYLALLALIIIVDTIVFAMQKKHINDLEREIRKLRKSK